MTGPFIICNIAKFPQSGKDPDTGNCSVMCGQDAAVLAKARGPNAKIDRTDFEAAWCKVQKEQSQKLARARGMGMSSPGGSGSGPTAGMGC
jgi:hypothetical protein